MLNIGTEVTNAVDPVDNSTSNPTLSNSQSQPPPMYTSPPPPSYGSYQGPPPGHGQGGPQGNAPPYGAPQGNRPPPAYTGGGGRGNYNQGGPRRGWGGGQSLGSLVGQGALGSQGNTNAAPLSDANSEGNPSNGSNGDRNEQRDSNINQARYKTRMCSNFLNGNCSWGNGCAFAHSDYERRLVSPNSNNNNAPAFGQTMSNGPSDRHGNNGSYPPHDMNRGGPPSGAPPPSYDRTGVPPPYVGTGSPHKGQRTPPPMVPVMHSGAGGGFPAGGANYVHSPISPRSPIKISSPTGQGQRFRYEPYSGLGKAFSSENLQGMASGPQSPREPKEGPKE